MSDVATKELHDELQKATSAFREFVEKEEAERKELGEATAETKAALEKSNERLDSIEGQIQKVALDTSKAAGEPSPEGKAFWEWTRKGDNVEPETKAALTIGDDSQGGFLAPPDVSSELLKGVVEFSPVRSIARVMTTTASSVKIRKRTGVFAAQWVDSGGARAETTGLAYGMEEIPTHELYALVDVENQLLEDSEFNVEAELQQEFSEQFGVAEGIALVSGSSSKRPKGFLTNTDVVVVESATDDVFVADDIIDLGFEIKTEYARNAWWALNRGILKTIRKLKDGNGQYIWQPGLASALPATILDRPYIEVPDMAATVADGAKVLAYGDFQRGYRIVDRVSLQVQRDPFTQNTAGATRFIARKRVGGQVVIPEAIKVLQIK